MSYTPIELLNDGDPVDRDTLNDLISNVDHLNDNKIIMKYDTPELIATRNLKIAAGRVDILPGKASETVTVDFEGFFETVSARPVVTATLSTTTRKRSFLTISNVTSSSFTLTVETSTGEPFSTGNSVHWTAMGF